MISSVVGVLSVSVDSELLVVKAGPGAVVVPAVVDNSSCVVVLLATESFADSVVKVVVALLDLVIATIVSDLMYMSSFRSPEPDTDVCCAVVPLTLSPETAARITVTALMLQMTKNNGGNDFTFTIITSEPIHQAAAS